MSLIARLTAVAISLGLWLLTQKWISARTSQRKGELYDAVHDWTSGTHRKLTRSPRAVKALLISSSLGIDGLALFVVAQTLWGVSLRPFAGLFILFALRQLCQGLVALPAPPGMIWRNPGFPSLLVTYGVSNDLFFSGHTAMAVYGALELMRIGSPGLGALGLVIVLYEITVVLLLRAHWTMDVVAGIFAALWVHAYVFSI